MCYMDVDFSDEIKKEIANEIVERIQYYSIEYRYLADLTDELFDSYYIMGMLQCEKWLKHYFFDTFEALNWYNEEFGKQYEEMLDLERLTGLVARTVANHLFQEVLYELDLDSNDMCDKQTEKLIVETLLNTYC